MTEDELNKYYDYLLDYDLFTKDELDLVTNICGFNEKTLNDCIYARYGVNDFEQLKEDIDTI